MTSTPRALSVLLALAGGAAAAATTPPQTAATPARFANVPARPLVVEDMRIRVAVPPGRSDLDGDLDHRTVDLREPDGLAALRGALVELDQFAQAQDDYQDAHPEHVLPFRYDVGSSGKRRALREMIAITDDLLASAPSAAGEPPGAMAAGREGEVLRLLELHHAVDNSFRYPIKKNYELVPDILPSLLIRSRSHRTVERSDEPGLRVAGSSDPSRDDPEASSFWSPTDPAAADLYAGFGRAAIPRYDGICEYQEPKTGWGAHPGFDVSCGGVTLRFNMGDERFGAPFNSRIFDALGYRTYPVDRMEALRLKYDRRVLTEYNSRKYLAMRARLLGIPLAKHVVTRIESPFDRIEAAVLTDGRRVPGSELARALLKDRAVTKGRPRPETVATNYNEELEGRIAYLVWQPGTIQETPEDVKQIGAWDYDQLDHAARREVRSVFALAAWVDEFNMRWENTRLAYVKEGPGWTLRHVFSDVGSGLGPARSMLSGRNSDVEAMPWEVTESKGEGKVTFSGFAPNVMNDAFAAMSWDDARWMVRRLARLSETQVLAALLSTSMSAAEVRLALEKLVSKRQRLVADFGLSSEFPELAARRVDRALDFDPSRPADLDSVSLRRPDGTRIVPAAGGLLVRAGHLVERGAATPQRADGPAVSGSTTSTAATNR